METVNDALIETNIEDLPLDNSVDGTEKIILEYEDANYLISLNNLKKTNIDIIYPHLDGIGDDIIINTTRDYIISNFDSFVTYTVRAINGTVIRNGETVSYTAPGELGPCGFFVNDNEVNLIAIQPPAAEIDSCIQIHASDYQYGSAFGNSVAISGDGNTIVVGSLYENFYDTGASYVYKKVNNEWVEEIKLVPPSEEFYCYFGNSVSINYDGTRIAIAAFGKDFIGDNDFFDDNGSVYIYNKINDIWTLEAELYPSNLASYLYFGCFISMDNTGTRIAIGAKGDSDVNNNIYNAGAVYIFTRNEVTWNEEAYIVSDERANNDYFGQSVSISGDGTRVIIGSPFKITSSYDEGGKAYIYLRTNVSWAQETKLISNDLTYYSRFGWAVDINDTGNIAIISAVNHPYNGTNGYGKAYIFTRSGTTWSEIYSMISSVPDYSYWFGFSVSINGDGTRIAIGANREDIDFSIVQAGAIYIFDFINNIWDFAYRLSPIDSGYYYNIGESVSLNTLGNRLIYGAPGGQFDWNECGVAYICG